MKAILFILLFSSISILTNSCSKIYFVGETTAPVVIYTEPSTSSTIVANVNTSTKLLIKKKSKKYYYVVYNGYQGYIYNTTFTNYHRFGSSDGILYGYSTTKTSSYKSSRTSLSPSERSSSGGPVHVKGYTRKNGTYISPHTRSAPSRRH